MKTKFAVTLFTLASVFGFTDETIEVQTLIAQPATTVPVVDVKITNTTTALKNSFSYLRMGIADPDAVRSVQAIPAVGFGYRYGMTKSAIDVSVNYSRDAKVADQERFSYTAPRVTYMRYVSNDLASQSFYYGVGAAWGANSKGDASDFQGVIGNASLGYSMNRNQDVVSFIQLDVSQPAVFVNSSTAAFAQAWAPLAEISVGLGY